MLETYVSTDIEADGPIPGPHSMLSLGSAAFTADKHLIGTFTVNLETLPGATAHPRPHTHVALDDAIEQGLLFCNMLRENTAGG